MTCSPAPTRVRSVAVAAAAVMAIALTGCGSDGGNDSDTRAEDAGQSTPSETPSGTSAPMPSSGAGAVDFDEVALLDASAAGGASSTTPTVLDSSAAVDEFVSQFTRGDLADQVRDKVAATRVPQGQTLLGTVISIGCDVPPGVAVRNAGELVVTALKVTKPLTECLAPVTTVALLLVDSASVG